jgi:hypothetical protein
LEEVPPPRTVSAESSQIVAIRAALDQLAFARDFAAVIASGSEERKDLPELADEVRKGINQAGTKLETALRDLQIFGETPGWFTP